MTPRTPRVANLRDTFSEPPFFGDPILGISRFLATSLLHVARVPHKYALCHTASGSGAHLRVFKQETGLGPIARADAADLASARDSITRCLFELLERVWSPKVNVASLAHRSRAELSDMALDPQQFVLLSDAEHESNSSFVRYSDHLPLHWAECWRLTDGGQFEPALVPAVFVYPGFGIRAPQERLVPMLSTGIAAGTRYDEALLHGLCEVVERDAFAISWLRRNTPPRVSKDAASLSASARSVIGDLEGDRFEVRFFDLTLDIEIPVAMAAITDRREGSGPRSVLGLGCSPWPTHALNKALAEALQQMTNRYEFPGGIHVIPKARETMVPADQLAARERELSAFLGSDAFSGRFDAPAVEANPTRTPEMLLRCLKTLQDRGFPVWFSDLTPTEEISDAKFCLVRTLIPGLQPHLYEPECWRLAGGRLHAPREQLGLQAGATSELNRTLNPLAWDSLA